MRAIHRAIAVTAMLAALSHTGARAQEAGDTAPEPTADSAPAPKKKGLFGKVKGVAENKVVQSVAKTAACTMVPGGQVIAGAIDAASSKSAGEAVSGAAGAAAGTSCMPGGLGAGGVAGGMAEQVPAGAMPGMGYAPMARYPDEDRIAECLGLTAEELAALTDPTGGEPREPTRDELKRQQQLTRKIDMARYQGCMMAAHQRSE